jgi:hypothetical protein
MKLLSQSFLCNQPGPQINCNYVIRFEVLTAVFVKSLVFCDITWCRALKVNQHFGGKYHLHLQDRRISQAKKNSVKQEAIC